MIRVLLCIALALVSYTARAGIGDKVNVQTNCELIEVVRKLSPTEEQNLTSFISETLSSFSLGIKESFAELLRNPLVLKNKQFTARTLCRVLTDNNAAFSLYGVEGTAILVQKAFPALGISAALTKRVIPALGYGVPLQVEFKQLPGGGGALKPCYAIEGYKQLLCVGIEERLAIDERFERRKARTGERGTHVVPYLLSEMVIDSMELTHYSASLLFHECGRVTWGECSFKRRHGKHQAVSDGNVTVDATLLLLTTTSAKYQLLLRHSPGA